MDKGNGNATPNLDEYSVLTVLWNKKTHSIELSFSHAEFLTWEFVLGILEMARLRADTERRLGQVQQIQAQAAEAKKNQDILARLNKGR